MASEEAAAAAVEAEAPQRTRYSPEDILKQLSDIPEEKRTFSSSRLLDALTCQLETLKAISEVKKESETATLTDMSNIILLFLKNIYNLVSGLPGALMFDALEDLMARTGLLAPFVNSINRVDETVVLELGLPSNDNVCETHDELIRVAAAGIVCFYHYTNFPAHPSYFPSDDATLLFTSLALSSCQDRAAAEALSAQLEAAGRGVISLGQIRWLMHYFRAQLSGLGGAVFLSMGDTRQHKQQLMAQQADFLGLIKAAPENPASYGYYVRTCLQFQQLSAASLFAAKGAVVAERHRATFYGAQLAAQRAIALALAGGGSSSTAAAAAAHGGSAVAAPAPPALVRAGELRGLISSARSGLAAEAAVLPEVYGDLVVLDPVDSALLGEKLDPLIAGVPDEGEVLALTDAMYPTRPPVALPRGAVAVRKP